MPSTSIALLSGILFGSICFYLSKKRGRNPTAWFAIGLLCGVIGLLLLYLLPTKKPSPTLATTPPTRMAEPEITLAPQGTTPPTASPPTPQKLWYYLDENNKRFGPMSFDALKRAWEEDLFDQDNYVWNEEMSDWKTVGELANLLAKLNKPTEPTKTP